MKLYLTLSDEQRLELINHLVMNRYQVKLETPDIIVVPEEEIYEVQTILQDRNIGYTDDINEVPFKNMELKRKVDTIYSLAKEVMELAGDISEYPDDEFEILGEIGNVLNAYQCAYGTFKMVDDGKEDECITFEKLLQLLAANTFQEIMTELQETEVECIGNEVYEDDDLYEFFEKIGVTLNDFGTGYARLCTKDDKWYEVPYEERENRFGNDLPNETILIFDSKRIHDVTDSCVSVNTKLSYDNIVEVEQDLLTTSYNIIAHQVNCKGVMGAGVAKQIREKLLKDSGYEVYRKLCCSRSPEELLGKVQFLSGVGDTHIANLFGENVPTGTGLDTDYEALEKALRELYAYASKCEMSVAFPGYLGCGLAGGDWNIVKKMIYDVFGGTSVKVEICYLPGTKA